ncbi:MAG: hypothetical protein K8T89_14420 [Planctomycetes bacterium]|nr:hypothetical protein [Planctomycetota bacterium]
MRNRFLGRIAFIILGGLAGAATFSWTSGQTPPPVKLPADLPALDIKVPPDRQQPTLQPVKAVTPPIIAKVATPPVKTRPIVAFDRFRNLESLPEQTRQLVMSAQIGMEWLYRYHQPSGSFLYGYLPAVNLPMEGDHFTHQALGSFTLARMARFTGDEKYLVRANQSVLALLSNTSIDANVSGARHPSQPSAVCNRLAGAGCLLMAIHELPDPSTDLLQKGEELCAFLRSKMRDDGSMVDADAASSQEAVEQAPGLALHGLALNLRTKPAAWKADMLRKAIAYYRKAFKQQPHPDLVPWMTAACVESYLTLKENAFAEFAFEMNDWLASLQYVESPDPRKPQWSGGFKNIARGKVDSASPGIEAGLYAQSLADCCRLLRQVPSPDLNRYERYRTCLFRSLQFLTTLQFNDANTQHFSANYRLFLVGGFHPTHLDGNLRIDQSASCVSALVSFLSSGADRAP